MKSNVLMTTIGRRGTLTGIFREELNNIGGKIVVTDNSPLAPAMYEADKYYFTPLVDDDTYLDKLIEISKKEDIKVIIPLLEKAFPLLASSIKLFENIGVNLLLSSIDTINLCKDKYKLSRYFKDRKIPTPNTYLISEVDESDISYPLFIKPRTGQGSEDTFVVYSQKQLEVFTEYIGEAVIQEYISGQEFTIDTLSDLEGNVLAVVPRKRIETRGGEVSKAVTVKNERLIYRVKDIIEGLGIIGPANIQAIITPEDEIKFIEINPRFGGGVPLSYQAGVNYPLLIARMVNGGKIEPFISQFQEGLTMLRYDQPLFKTVEELEGEKK